MTTNIVVKSLALAEDLAVGYDKLTQTRNGNPVTGYKVFVPAAVSSEAALANIDISKYTYGVVVTAGNPVYYAYDPTGAKPGVQSAIGAGTWFLVGADKYKADLAGSEGTKEVGRGTGTLEDALQAIEDRIGLNPQATTYNIPGDFANWTEAAEHFSKVSYWGEFVTVIIASGTYTWDTLPKIFGTEWGHGRLQFIGAGKDITVIQFDKKDGIFAPATTCFGKPPQFPVAGGDVVPIIKNATLSGISRDSGVDDPYRDAMGVRAFDGGVVVLDASVRITQFSRVGVMAERQGEAFVPGVVVDTTGSDSFAAYYGGFIYCPDTIATNPKGHCYIAGNGGQLYMPNAEAKNAVYHSGTIGGSGLVLTSAAIAYALNFKTHDNIARGVSVALNSYCRADGLQEYSNGLEIGVSQNSTLSIPNSSISKPNALAMLVEKGGTVLFQIASTDTFTFTGRMTVQSLSKVHAPDGTINNSSGNSVAVLNSTVDLDRTVFTGAPAVAINAMSGAIVRCVNGSSQTTSGTTIIAQNAVVTADGFQVKGTPSNGMRAFQMGRISAIGSSVVQAGQYGYTVENLGAIIDATNTTIGNAFTAYRATNGGQINATGANPTGTYDDNKPYIPAINTVDNKSTLIIH